MVKLQVKDTLVDTGWQTERSSRAGHVLAGIQGVVRGVLGMHPHAKEIIGAAQFSKVSTLRHAGLAQDGLV